MDGVGNTEETYDVTTEVLTVANNLSALVHISFVTTSLRCRSSDARANVVRETYRFRGSRWRAGRRRWGMTSDVSDVTTYVLTVVNTI